MYRILLLLDDSNGRDQACRCLSAQGYRVTLYEESRIINLAESDFDLVLWDYATLQAAEKAMVNHTHFAHFSVSCPKALDTPRLMVVSAKELSQESLPALCACEDYILFPFTDGELLVRVGVVAYALEQKRANRVTLPQVTLDMRSNTVETATGAIQLPRKEFALLYFLLTNPGVPFTRRQLMDGVWGAACDTDERTVDVHIKRLRSRFPGDEAFRIVTVRGVGYRGELLTP